MTRRWPALLLAVFLAWSQEAALLHGLTHHLPHAAAQAGTPAGDHDSDDHCATCFAFAHVAFAVATADVAMAVPAGVDHWVRETGFVRLPAPAPVACARDPPRV